MATQHHLLNSTGIRLICALFCWLAVFLFFFSIYFLATEHTRCPDDSYEPDDGANPNHCVSGVHCVDEDTLLCLEAEDPILSVIYYLMLECSIIMCGGFALWLQFYILRLHENFFFGSKLKKKNFCTVACAGSLFIGGLTMFVIGVIVVVEAMTQCQDGTLRVTSPSMEMNPLDCSKCVGDESPWQCIDEYEVDTVLLVVGLLMIIPCLVFCCFAAKVMFQEDESQNALLSRKSTLNLLATPYPTTPSRAGEGMSFGRMSTIEAQQRRQMENEQVPSTTNGADEHMLVAIIAQNGNGNGQETTASMTPLPMTPLSKEVTAPNAEDEEQDEDEDRDRGTEIVMVMTANEDHKEEEEEEEEPQLLLTETTNGVNEVNGVDTVNAVTAVDAVEADSVRDSEPTADPTSNTDPEPKLKPKTEMESGPKVIIKVDPDPDPESQNVINPDPEMEPQAVVVPEPAKDPQPEPEPEPEHSMDPQPEPEQPMDPKPEHEMEPEPNAEPKVEPDRDPDSDPAPMIEAETASDKVVESTVNDKGSADIDDDTEIEPPSDVAVIADSKGDKGDDDGAPIDEEAPIEVEEEEAVNVAIDGAERVNAVKTEKEEQTEEVKEEKEEEEEEEEEEAVGPLPGMKGNDSLFVPNKKGVNHPVEASFTAETSLGIDDSMIGMAVEYGDEFSELGPELLEESEPEESEKRTQPEAKKQKSLKDIGMHGNTAGSTDSGVFQFGVYAHGGASQANLLTF